MLYTNACAGLWNAERRAVIKSIKAHAHCINSLCMHESGIVISAAWDQCVRVWDLRVREQGHGFVAVMMVCVLMWEIFDLAFSSKGSVFACVGSDGVWVRAHIFCCDNFIRSFVRKVWSCTLLHRINMFVCDVRGNGGGDKCFWLWWLCLCWCETLRVTSLYFQLLLASMVPPHDVFAGCFVILCMLAPVFSGT